ncbi:MAG: hypothetical protein D6676_02670 [Cyanobacteria bacterium J003]|nr:MAG: hypothetical protein D6676_02670 [Cyanobacteria bacterium J003]
MIVTVTLRCFHLFEEGCSTAVVLSGSNSGNHAHKTDKGKEPYPYQDPEGHRAFLLEKTNIYTGYNVTKEMVKTKLPKLVLDTMWGDLIGSWPVRLLGTTSLGY